MLTSDLPHQRPPRPGWRRSRRGRPVSGPRRHHRHRQPELHRQPRPCRPTHHPAPGRPPHARYRPRPPRGQLALPGTHRPPPQPHRRTPGHHNPAGYASRRAGPRPTPNPQRWHHHGCPPTTPPRRRQRRKDRHRDRRGHPLLRPAQRRTAQHPPRTTDQMPNIRKAHATRRTIMSIRTGKNRLPSPEAIQARIAGSGLAATRHAQSSRTSARSAIAITTCAEGQHGPPSGTPAAASCRSLRRRSAGGTSAQVHTLVQLTISDAVKEQIRPGRGERDVNRPGLVVPLRCTGAPGQPEVGPVAADLTRLQREQPIGGEPSRVRGPTGQTLNHRAVTAEVDMQPGLPHRSQARTHTDRRDGHQTGDRHLPARNLCAQRLVCHQRDTGRPGHHPTRGWWPDALPA